MREWIDVVQYEDLTEMMPSCSWKKDRFVVPVHDGVCSYRCFKEGSKRRFGIPT